MRMSRTALVILSIIGLVLCNAPVSRAQLVCTGSVFTDVSAGAVGDAFCGYIEYFSTLGITGGCNAAPPRYCPDTPVTRGQMAVFVAKAVDPLKGGANSGDTFTYDNQAMGWSSIGWKGDSWFQWGSSAWIAGYGGIKFFTGGVQPAVSIGYWGGMSVQGNITKTGTVSFVERHPADSSKAIVYVSLEGGEAGTYSRGTAVLQNGTTMISLPEHFSLVTSNEGLTVQVTPNGPCNGLYVAGKSNAFIEVGELGNGTSNVSFDWIVHGIRKGYESYDPITDDPAFLKALDEAKK
jgi:hypothetical protein